MKVALTLLIIATCSLAYSPNANAAQPCPSWWFTPQMICDAPALTWISYTSPKEHEEQKRREEEAKKAPYPASPCCHDAKVIIHLDACRPCYTEQGLKSFAALFSAAAERGVENAAVRALNQIEVDSSKEAKK